MRRITNPYAGSAMSKFGISLISSDNTGKIKVACGEPQRREFR